MTWSIQDSSMALPPCSYHCNMGIGCCQRFYQLNSLWQSQLGKVKGRDRDGIWVACGTTPTKIARALG